MNPVINPLVSRLEPTEPYWNTRQTIAPPAPGIWGVEWQKPNGALVCADELIVTCRGSGRKRAVWSYHAPWAGLLEILFSGETAVTGGTTIGVFHYGATLAAILAKERQAVSEARDKAAAALRQAEATWHRLEQQYRREQTLFARLESERNTRAVTPPPAESGPATPTPDDLLTAFTERLQQDAIPTNAALPDALARRLLELLCRLETARHGQPPAPPAADTLGEALDRLYQDQAAMWQAAAEPLPEDVKTVLVTLWRQLKHAHLQSLLQEQTS